MLKPLLIAYSSKEKINKCISDSTICLWRYDCFDKEIMMADNTLTTNSVIATKNTQNMKLKSLILLLTCITIIQSCSTTKKHVYWISGLKTECSGVSQIKCLKIHKGDALNNPNWENFHGAINGFEFEEGYLKKIKVKVEKLDPENVPSDGSAIKYTLIKELEKQLDYQKTLASNWILTQINDIPINRSIELPSIEIDPVQQRIFGSGGCNTYSGPIEKLSPEGAEFGNILSTRMACLDSNIENDYFAALGKVKSYQVNGSALIFYDEKNTELLTFLKQEEKKVNQRLHDIWVVLRINSNSLNRISHAPRLEINLTENKIMGNDSCNEFFGPILEVSDKRLILGKLASTKKMCPEMELAGIFHQAMKDVSAYELDGLNLTLLDSAGNELLYLLKVD